MRALFLASIMGLAVGGLATGAAGLETAHAAVESGSKQVRSESVHRVSSDEHNLGLGVMFGVPTGVTLKYLLSNSNALNFGLTYSFGNYFTFLGDYLWQFPNAFSSASFHKKGHRLIPYFGLGLAFFVNSQGASVRYSNGSPFYHSGSGWSDVALGARIPFGLEFIPKSTQLGIFAELVPGLGVIPGMFAFLQGVVGARFYF